MPVTNKETHVLTGRIQDGCTNRSRAAHAALDDITNKETQPSISTQGSLPIGHKLLSCSTSHTQALPGLL